VISVNRNTTWEIALYQARLEEFMLFSRLDSALKRSGQGDALTCAEPVEVNDRITLAGCVVSIKSSLCAEPAALFCAVTTHQVYGLHNVEVLSVCK